MMSLSPLTTAIPLVSAPQAAASQSVTSLIDMLNSYRMQNGLAPVQMDRRMMSFAQQQAAAMQAAGMLSHDVAGGFSQRLAAVGLEDATAVENVSMGYTSPEHAFEGWVRSPHHNANLLKAGVSRAGVAMARGPNGIFWALDLSSD